MRNNKWMQYKVLLAIALFAALIVYIFHEAPLRTAPQNEPMSHGQIYLYGEKHGKENVIEKEYELWFEYYHNEDMRHLFLEMPYYTAEFLNIWMKEDTDEIFDATFLDASGAAADNPYTKEFYHKIKKECPDTIFHGTDVGHQYETTGERYLKYLKEHNMQDSEQYEMALKCIEQGKIFYKDYDSAYRENKMAENFMDAFDKLNGESIMGIYGAGHMRRNTMDSSGTVPRMIDQVKEYYGDIVHVEMLTRIHG